MLSMPHVLFLASLGKYGIGTQVLYEQLLTITAKTPITFYFI